MIRVAVISACYGEYDQVKPVPEQDIAISEWIMVTDDPMLDAPGWKIVFEPRKHMHPRLAAKVPKCSPWLYTDADTTIWMDSSCRLLRTDALSQILNASAGHYLSQVVHPWRDDITEEAYASMGMPKYKGQSVVQQAAHYTSLGHAKGWGLWATGLIVRDRVREVDLEAFGRDWLAEQVRWTYQDQISQPYLLRRDNLTVRPLPFPLHGSGVFEWHAHRDDS